MGKNARKRKNKVPMFSEEDIKFSQKITETVELIIGSKVKIIESSFPQYQYIYSTLDFQKVEQLDLSPLVNTNEANARVTGIVNLASGESIAIIQRADGLPFFENYFKIYVDRDKVIASGELKVHTKSYEIE